MLAAPAVTTELSNSAPGRCYLEEASSEGSLRETSKAPRTMPRLLCRICEQVRHFTAVCRGTSEQARGRRAAGTRQARAIQGTGA